MRTAISFLVLGLMMSIALCMFVQPVDATFTMQVKNSTAAYHPMDSLNTVYRGDTVKFTSTGGAVSFDWDFGDGFSSNATSPEHQYTFGKTPIIMHNRYKNLTARLNGGDATTIRFTTPMLPLVTESATIAPFSENLTNQYLDALAGVNASPDDYGFNWAGIIDATVSGYSGVIGSVLFYTIVFSIPFILMWIISKDFVVPGIIGGFLGIFIIARLPAGMQLLGVAFIVMALVAIVYSLLKERT